MATKAMNGGVPDGPTAASDHEYNEFMQSLKEQGGTPTKNNDWSSVVVASHDDTEFNEFISVVKGETKQQNGTGRTHTTHASLTALPLPSAITKPSSSSDNNGEFRSSAARRESSVFARRDGHLLEFDNVTLSTKANGPKKPSRVILDKLTSLFEPRSLTAVMGPSGSGKTSLLKILTGRVGKNNSSGLNLQGIVRLDGQKVDPTSLVVRKMIAYVEQEVSIPATCTPREAITFSARLRLDARITNKDIDLLVEDILENLGLTHVADTLIGGGPLMSGGLSGGEKKRVQCGVELVTRPSLVVLDEPTSGLDSYSAQALMDLLKKIANAGATVIVTIHQPPPPVVRKIDNLLLLLGGNILYDGPMGGPVEEIFESRGFPKPSDYNIADWILQVAQTTTIKELEGCGFFNQELEKDLHTKRRTSVIATTTTAASLGAVIQYPGMVVQTRLLFDRAMKQLFRDKLAFVIRIVSNVVFGVLFGCIFFQVGESDYETSAQVGASFGAQINLLISTMFGVAQSSLMEFPKDRPVFLREYSTNHYSIFPYFLSKFSLECITTMIQCLSQLLCAFFLMGFQQRFVDFLALQFLLGIASSSIGLFIGSCVEDPSVAAEMLPALIVPQLLFSGFFIQTNLIPVWLSWAQYLCSLVYATRLVTHYEFGECDSQACIGLLEANGVYQLEAYYYWIILCAIAVIFRTTAMVVLKGKASF